MRILIRPVSLLQNLVDPSALRKPEDPREQLLEAVAAAHREWQAAEAYFQGVTEPELVDHAILVLEAARRKYTYLVRQARQNQPASS